MQEPPIGAIENGREHMRRLLEHYHFTEAEGHLLQNCSDFAGLQQCFEAMADWIAEESDGWEPSEVQQGLIPIPNDYDEA